MSLRGILAGSLALVALQAVTATNASAGRVGGMLSAVATGVRVLLDPAVPLIPDLAGVDSTA